MTEFFLDGNGKKSVDYQDDSDGLVKRARADKETYGVSERDYQAFRAHYDSAKTRGIPFHFSLLGWCLWWHQELRKLGPDATRGRNRGNYVMGRIGDAGAYEPGNVLCMSVAENAHHRDMRQATEKTKQTLTKTGRKPGSHLKIRGDGHPKSKAVVTPLGRFGSIALAAEAHGITRQGGFYAVRRGAWTLAP